jgi:hypothetical protein
MATWLFKLDPPPPQKNEQQWRSAIHASFLIRLRSRSKVFLAPSRQNLIEVAGDRQARGGAFHTAGQQLIVWGMVVANRGANRQGQRCDATKPYARNESS